MSTETRELTGFWALLLTQLAFWLLVSGQLDAQHIIAGVLSAFVVSWYWRGLLRRMHERHDILPYRLLFCPDSIPYFIYLLVQIVKANFKVAMIVLNPRLPISPVVLRTRTCLRHDLTRVAFAHSVTLTPGTLTLSLSGDHLVVHSLTKEAADIDDLIALEARMARIERGLDR